MFKGLKEKYRVLKNYILNKWYDHHEWKPTGPIDLGKLSEDTLEDWRMQQLSKMLKDGRAEITKVKMDGVVTWSKAEEDAKKPRNYLLEMRDDLIADFESSGLKVTQQITKPLGNLIKRPEGSRNYLAEMRDDLIAEFKASGLKVTKQKPDSMLRASFVSKPRKKAE